MLWFFRIELLLIGNELEDLRHLLWVCGLVFIFVETFRPFICGLSRCGDPLTADDSRFVWRVTIHGPRTSYFRTGGSMAGDRLGQIAAAEDLECRLRTLQPSHTDLLISYEA